MKLYIETPLLESTPLSRILGVPVWLKMEALQPSGSFKNRGIGNLCTHYASKGAKRFVSSSGGNAGLAVAYSGRKLQVPVTVIVPESTSKMMIEKIRMEGAEVIVHGQSWDEADLYARSLLQDHTYYIPPFDHPLIWQGHSTMIDEITKVNDKPGAILLAVGGGGLLCGVIEGLHRAEWQDVPVIAVETEGAASFAASVQAGRVTTLKEIHTVATSLGAKTIAQQAFEWTKKHRIESAVVSDEEAINAASQFAHDHRILVEPACGAPLSLVYNKNAILQSFSSILVIVCGGCNVSK